MQNIAFCPQICPLCGVGANNCSLCQFSPLSCHIQPVFNPSVWYAKPEGLNSKLLHKSHKSSLNQSHFSVAQSFWKFAQGRAWQWYCNALCNISIWLGSWDWCYGCPIFGRIWVYDQLGAYYNMTVWILAGNYISFTIAAGLIGLHMPGVKKSRV